MTGEANEGEAGLSIHALFPGREGVEIEIGPGKGMYILERARSDPHWGFLALEVKAKLAGLIRDRASRGALDNLVVLRADARLLLPSIEPDGSVDRIVLNFPDPWWKKRHRKKAVLGPGTMDEFARLLRPGGTLLVQTDVFDRASGIMRLLTDDVRFGNSEPGGGFSEAPADRAVSNRERICRESGLPVFRMVFRRLA